MVRYTSDFPVFFVTVDVVLFALRGGRLQVLVVRRRDEPFAGQPALPGGFVHVDEDLDAAARRELTEETGVSAEGLVLEQLRTFGTPGRDPRPERVVSVAHLAVTPCTDEPTAGTDALSAWWAAVDDVAGTLAFDHDEILTAARDRIAAKLEYTSVAASFLSEQFTLAELRGVYEAVWGLAIDPGNFQRKLRASDDFVVATRHTTAPPGGRGRPAQLFRSVAAPFAPLASPIIRSSM